MKQQTIAQQVPMMNFSTLFVMIDDEMIGEGYIQLKPVFAELEKYGFVAMFPKDYVNKAKILSHFANNGFFIMRETKPFVY